MKTTCQTEREMTPLNGGFRINFTLLSRVLYAKAHMSEDPTQSDFDKRVNKTHTRTVIA